MTALGLVVTLQGRAVVRLPEFVVQAGEVWQIHGANGAGKTTLLRALSGDLAHEGTVWVGGARPGTLQARTASLLVPTEADLIPDLSVREALTFMAAAWDRPAAPLLDLAQDFGLLPVLDAWPEELSRGTRQKVALASALGLGLPLTLLDEPYATLDPASRGVLTASIQARARAGGALIVTTHGDELAGLERRHLELGPVLA